MLGFEEGGAGVNNRQAHIIKHALGLTRGEAEYRNHFVTGPGSSDYSDCMTLVDSGMMLRRPGSELTGGDYLFVVTDKGRSMLAAHEQALIGGE
jgi:hypothetical protein